MEEATSKEETQQEPQAETKEEAKARPTSLLPEELWKMRALLTKKENCVTKLELLKAQVLLVQKDAAEVERDVKDFQVKMAAKYGSDAQALPSGELKYGG